jgi:hypothetical protein
LFMQALTLFNLINKVLSILIPYYVQRFPGDLGNFSWILDHKGGKITEEIMEKLIYPFLQNRRSTKILSKALPRPSMLIFISRDNKQRVK